MQTIDSKALSISPHLLQSLEDGETVVLSKNSRPIAFLVSALGSSAKRPIGLCAGEFHVPDDFNEPSHEIEALFYGEANENSPSE